ncbi:UMP kinase [Candidatus Woesearchaeota archaeon]|nr:UMP kinase [Candidatus Woesearchaeota archaeon]
MRPWLIISLGGSLVVPDEIDVAFLSKFCRMARSLLRRYRLVLIVGGGRTARRYSDAAKKLKHDVTDDDRDWLGIHATRLNAHLLRTLFRDVAAPVIVKDPTAELDKSHGVIVAAGWKPGCSTDYDAVLIAKQLKAGMLINLTNIDYVYDKDPRNSKDAKPLPRLSWQQYRRMVGDKWSPGLNAPFDPVASRMAQQLRMRVIILNGKHLERVRLFIAGRPFVGTVIE